MTLIKPQLGLYEDDIVYRLTMLAVNVLEPLKKQFPQVVVRSGFRETNGGIGQHERGEAVDLQLSNQTNAFLLAMAKYIRDNLPFDQLILNFSNQSLPWVHVSFSPTAPRQEVLTKNFADAFVSGLAIVEPYVGEEATAKLREQTAIDALIMREMTKMQARDTRGNFATVYGDAITDTGGTVAGDVSVIVNHRDVVVCVKAALPNLTGMVQAFAIVCRVAWLLRDEGAGLMTMPADTETCVEWNGYWVSAQRIVYSDGTSYQILGDAGGRNNPGWELDATPAGEAAWLAPMDPGQEYGTEWTSCFVPHTGSGTGFSTPRITSRLDPAYLRAAIAASWRGVRGEDISQSESDNWFKYPSHPDQYGDGIWRLGWNRYWEWRMRVDDDGTGNPSDGDRPALYQPSGF